MFCVMEIIALCHIDFICSVYRLFVILLRFLHLHRFHWRLTLLTAAPTDRLKVIHSAKKHKARWSCSNGVIDLTVHENISLIVLWLMTFPASLSLEEQNSDVEFKVKDLEQIDVEVALFFVCESL